MKKHIMLLALSLFCLSFSGQTKTVSKTSSSKTSVSVHKDDRKYLYTSHFDWAKTTAAKSIIIRNLGRPNEDNKLVALWKEKGFNVSVWDGKVQIQMDYEQTDRSMIPKIENMGDEISRIIN